MRPWLQPSRAQMQKPRGKCLLPLWSLPGPECPFHRPRAAQRAYWTRSGVRTAGQNCSSTNWHKRPTEGIFLSLSTSRVGRGRGCKVERRSEQGSELQPQYAPLSIAARTALTHLAQSTFNKSCTFFRSVFQWWLGWPGSWWPPWWPCWLTQCSHCWPLNVRAVVGPLL